MTKTGAAKHGQGTMPVTDYTCCRPGIVSHDIEMDGGSHPLFIPGKVMEVFNEEFNYRVKVTPTTYHGEDARTGTVNHENHNI